MLASVYATYKKCALLSYCCKHAQHSIYTEYTYIELSSRTVHASYLLKTAIGWNLTRFPILNKSYRYFPTLPQTQNTNNQTAAFLKAFTNGKYILPANGDTRSLHHTSSPIRAWVGTARWKRYKIMIYIWNTYIHLIHKQMPDRETRKTGWELNKQFGIWVNVS